MNLSTQRVASSYQDSANAYKYWDNIVDNGAHKNHTYSKNRTARQKRKHSILMNFYLKILGCVGIIICSNVMFLNSYISIGTKQTELMELTNHLREIQSDIAFTEAKISKAMDISMIEATAYKKLNMSKPLPHQIEYISLD